MKSVVPWLFGFLIGMILCAVIAGILILRSALGPRDDPEFRLVAVSWGSPMNQTQPWVYQAQVTANNSMNHGVYEITARVCIGSSSYFQDLGVLGTAKDMGEAVRIYGQIVWLPDRVTVGGENGIKATLLRSELQKHR